MLHKIPVKTWYHINSGCAGMTSEDTALPFHGSARLIVGKRHCRVLILGYINSDATGIDIIQPKIKYTIAG